MAATATHIRYNQYPKDFSLLKKIPKLGRNEKVRYRVIGSSDPLKPGKYYGPSIILPGTDVITDPETDEVYDIAFVKNIGAGGVQETESIPFDDFSEFSVTLRGDNPEDVRKYQYLELSNYLKDNPNSDPSKHKIERVDPMKDINMKRDRRAKINAALNAVAAMSDSEILNFVRSNRLPDVGSPEGNRMQVEDIAENDPDKFEKMPIIDFQSLFPLIDEAKKAKVITFNNVSRAWQRFDGTLILQVQKGLSVSIKDELARHLMRPEGHRDLEWIKEELKKK